MTADTDGVVCAVIYSSPDHGSFSSSCATEDTGDDGVVGPDDIAEPIALDEEDSSDLVFGVVPDGAGAVEVVTDTGSPIEADLYVNGDLTAYVGEVPAGREGVEVVFLDDAGDELYRESLE